MYWALNDLGTLQNIVVSISLKASLKAIAFTEYRITSSVMYVFTQTNIHDKHPCKNIFIHVPVLGHINMSADMYCWLWHKQLCICGNECRVFWWRAQNVHVHTYILVDFSIQTRKSPLLRCSNNFQMWLHESVAYENLGTNTVCFMCCIFSTTTYLLLNDVVCHLRVCC